MVAKEASIAGGIFLSALEVFSAPLLLRGCSDA
jgi:hypothetical protein